MKILPLSLAGFLLAGVAIAQTSPSRDSNVAVQTQDAKSAAGPAKGSNSFTEGQAKNRIEEKGYSNVSGLAKDDDGIWRGRAQKDGSQVNVWVDYKGAVGHGS